MLRWLTAYLFALASAINPALAALTVNQLSGFNAFTTPVEGGGPSVTFIGCQEDTSNATTYTLTGASIGTAETGRIVVIAIASEDSASGFGVNSVTFDGVSATRAFTYGAVALNVAGNIAMIQKDTGTTSSIAITHSESVTGIVVCKWALYGFTATGFTDSSTTYDETNTSAALTVTASNAADGDFLLAWCYNNSTSPGTTQTWTGDFTDGISQTLGTEISYAYQWNFPFTSGDSNEVTCNWSGSTQNQLRVVTIRP
jgi:hypothetical protein